MNELEKDYVHIDDNGNAQFVSYDTVGGGMFMIAVGIGNSIHNRHQHIYSK